MDKGARLVVERLDACAAWEHLLLQEDREAAARLRGERRMGEFLAWRSLLRRELGPVGIGYAPSGAPQLANGGFLSVSHCERYVALCIADGPCGVDVESLERNFGRVVGRYASADELALSDDPRLYAALWCAKETLYKYAGREGLDFVRDLCIVRIDFEAGVMEGSVCGGTPVAIRFRTFDGHLVAWTG
jgi:hypothetical protein